MKKPQKDKSADTSLFNAVRQVLETADAKTGLNELSNEIAGILMEQPELKQTTQRQKQLEAIRVEAVRAAEVARVVAQAFEEHGLTAEQGFDFFLDAVQGEREKNLRQGK